MELRVYKIAPSDKYPDGIKSRFALIDVELNLPRLVIDNHAPYGFHAHTTLPKDESTRVKLDVKDYFEAYEEFISEAERIVKNEE